MNEEPVTIHESVNVCSFSMMVRCIPTPSHNVPFSLFNTVYIGMVTHERTGSVPGDYIGSSYITVDYRYRADISSKQNI